MLLPAPSHHFPQFPRHRKTTWCQCMSHTDTLSVFFRTGLQWCTPRTSANVRDFPKVGTPKPGFGVFPLQRRPIPWMMTRGRWTSCGFTFSDGSTMPFAPGSASLRRERCDGGPGGPGGPFFARWRKKKRCWSGFRSPQWQLRSARWTPSLEVWSCPEKIGLLAGFFEMPQCQHQILNIDGTGFAALEAAMLLRPFVALMSTCSWWIARPRPASPCSVRKLELVWQRNCYHAPKATYLKTTSIRFKEILVFAIFASDRLGIVRTWSCFDLL